MDALDRNAGVASKSRNRSKGQRCSQILGSSHSRHARANRRQSRNDEPSHPQTPAAARADRLRRYRPPSRYRRGSTGRREPRCVRAKSHCRRSALTICRFERDGRSQVFAGTPTEPETAFPHATPTLAKRGKHSQETLREGQRTDIRR